MTELKAIEKRLARIESLLDSMLDQTAAGQPLGPGRQPAPDIGIVNELAMAKARGLSVESYLRERARRENNV